MIDLRKIIIRKFDICQRDTQSVAEPEEENQSYRTGNRDVTADSLGPNVDNLLSIATLLWNMEKGL